MKTTKNTFSFFKLWKNGILLMMVNTVLIWYVLYRRQAAQQKFGNGTRDIIDETGWESFPASDPPASNVFN